MLNFKADRGHSFCHALKSSKIARTRVHGTFRLPRPLPKRWARLRDRRGSAASKSPNMPDPNRRLVGILKDSVARAAQIRQASVLPFNVPGRSSRGPVLCRGLAGPPSWSAIHLPRCRKPRLPQRAPLRPRACRRSDSCLARSAPAIHPRAGRRLPTGRSRRDRSKASARHPRDSIAGGPDSADRVRAAHYLPVERVAVSFLYSSWRPR